MDHVIDGIITIDDLGRSRRSIRRRSVRLFRLHESEVIGKNVKMLMPEPLHGGA